MGDVCVPRVRACLKQGLTTYSTNVSWLCGTEARRRSQIEETGSPSAASLSPAVFVGPERIDQTVAMEPAHQLLGHHRHAWLPWMVQPNCCHPVLLPGPVCHCSPTLGKRLLVHPPAHLQPTQPPPPPAYPTLAHPPPLAHPSPPTLGKELLVHLPAPLAAVAQRARGVGNVGRVHQQLRHVRQRGSANRHSRRGGGGWRQEGISPSSDDTCTQAGSLPP